MRSSYYYGSGDLAGMLAIILVLGLAALAVMIIAQWKLFQKAGEPGWKCLIPFYNGFLWYKLTWSVGAWVALLVLSILFAFLASIPIISIIISIITLIMYCVSCHKVSRSYGQSGGFTVGLIILPFIFYLILAFGSSKYVGPEGVPAYRGGSGDTSDGNPYEKTRETETAERGSGLIWILTGICLTATVLFFGAEMMLSMEKYNLFKGLFQSQFVGFDYYQRLFANSAYPNALLHSVVYSLLTAVLTVLAGFAGMGLGKSGNAGRKAGITFGFLLAAVPRFSWESLINLASVSPAADILCGALSWCGLSLAAGALLARRLGGGVRSALVVSAMFLMSFLNGQEGVRSLIDNPLNRRIMRADIYLYQMGLLNGQFSYSAAGYVLNALFTLPFAVGGCILLAMLTRNARKDPDGQRARFIDAVPGIAAAVLLAAIGAYLAFGRGNILSGNASVSQAVTGTLAEILFALPVGFGLFLLVQVLGGKKGAAAGGFSRAAFLFAVFSLGQTWVTEYLLMRKVGLLDTRFAVALSWLFSPRALAMAVILMLARPKSMAECVRFALAAALMAIVLGIGDTRASVTYLRQTDVSLLLYRTLTNADAASMTADNIVASPTLFRDTRLAVWGVFVLTTALPFGVSLALSGMKAVKE